jgi:hypothetical protein
MKETVGNKESDDSKSLNVNEKDIDNLIKDKEKQLELNPNAILDNLDSLSKSEQPKEEETLTGMESCEDIKKYGKQRLYCEEKFLLKFGEEKTVNCMKNFCSICCESDENCKDRCSTTHSFFKGHDPEEMFISVCAFENMGPAFKNFCGSMIVDDNKKEYDQCFTNFCFDCCSNELKITDFNDIEIQKCLKICKEGKNKPASTVRSPTIKNSSKPNGRTNIKPIELSDEIKKILEKSGGNSNEKASQGSTIQDINQNVLKADKHSEIKNIREEDRMKELSEANEKIENSLKVQEEKTTAHQKRKVIQKKENTKKIIPIKIDDKLSRKESILLFKQENTKICEALILNLNIDSYGKEVASSCNKEYKKYHFPNEKECKANLCSDCCGFLEISKSK